MLPTVPGLLVGIVDAAGRDLPDTGVRRTRRARGSSPPWSLKLDVGHPDHVELIFRGHPRRSGRPPKREQSYRPASIAERPSGHRDADYKHSQVKQYLKDGRALRIETVINDAGDLGCLRRLEHLDELQTRARAVNDRLLDTERVGQGCVLASRAQPLSGSHSPPSMRMAEGRPHYGSEILGSWPCSAPCVSG